MTDVNELRPPSAERVPTLTEVVHLGPASDFLAVPDLLPLPEVPLVLVDTAPVLAHQPLPVSVLAPWPAPEPAIDTDAVISQVWAELAPRIDALLESRLREALAPALARAADGLIRDAAGELSVTLRAVVEETVAQVLRRQGKG